MFNFLNLLLEQVGKRQLVKVTKTKQNKQEKLDELPMFKLMSDTELEVATRKEKSHSTNYRGSRTNYGKIFIIFSCESDSRVSVKDADMLKKMWICYLEMWIC